MTGAEWLACDDPCQLLEHLRDKATNRKLRQLGTHDEELHSRGCWVLHLVHGKSGNE